MPCQRDAGGLAPVIVGLGLTGDLTNDPAGVIEKYLSLDQRGARLTAQSYEAVAPYVAWKEEPVWEQLVVIRDYAVDDDVTQWDIVSGTEALIPVTFQVLGVVAGRPQRLFRSHGKTRCPFGFAPSTITGEWSLRRFLRTSDDNASWIL